MAKSYQTLIGSSSSELDSRIHRQWNMKGWALRGNQFTSKDYTGKLIHCQVMVKLDAKDSLPDPEIEIYDE